MKKREVIVLIPAHNAAKTITGVIDSIPSTIKAGKQIFTTRAVVVIDDDKELGTYAEATKAGATVIRHLMNLGPGAATRTGLRYILAHGHEADYIVTIDADGQHSGSDIEKMVKFAEKHKAHFVVGNRLHEGNKKNMPWSRWFGNYIITWFSRALFFIHTKDTQSGLRLFSTKILPKIANYSIDWYGFCTELLWIARRNGIKIYETPIAVHYSKDTLRRGQNHWGVVPLMKDLIWIRITN